MGGGLSIAIDEQRFPSAGARDIVQEEGQKKTWRFIAVLGSGAAVKIDISPHISLAANPRVRCPSSINTPHIPDPIQLTSIIRTQIPPTWMYMSS